MAWPISSATAMAPHVGMTAEGVEISRFEITTAKAALTMSSSGASAIASAPSAVTEAYAVAQPAPLSRIQPPMIGAIAGVFAICDGVLFVQSRMGMLDIFQALFVVAAFGCLVVDRDDVRARLRSSWAKRGATDAELGWTDSVLDPEVLTIGFARRVPTYKRLTLMLRDPERLRALLLHPERPVQLVIAGKSHPADETGKQLIQHV